MEFKIPKLELILYGLTRRRNKKNTRPQHDGYRIKLPKRLQTS